MLSKNIKILLGFVVGIILVTAAFSGGFLAGFLTLADEDGSILNSIKINSSLSSSEDGQTETGTATALDRNILFRSFWQAWDLVHDEYVDQPVDDVAMMRGAITGMLEALGDEHTSYIDPELLKQDTIQLQGEYEGIGAWVDITGEWLTIISPMPESPAEKAGLKPGDIVLAIDGVDMTGKSGDFALQRVLGPAGTKVVLTIQRVDTENPFDVTIKRGKINVPSVTSKMLDGNIGYVRIMIFGDNTGFELETALKDLQEQNMVGLVVDLRNNGGGLITTAEEVGTQFLKPGILMYEQSGDGTLTEYTTGPGGLATEIPMVVLVNEGSASASEIIAGAVQDTGRAKLVGETTYGKGSVQNWIQLRDEQGAVRITIARWLTPNKRQINEIGLTPDVVVKITEADIEAQIDTQLNAAVELLTAQ